jgi:uncharacterized membrane protein SpoIIM required for sporulation
MFISKILSNPTFRSEFKKVVAYAFIVLIMCIIGGLAFAFIAQSALVAYQTSVSGQAMEVVKDDLFNKFMAMWFLNSFVIGMLFITPRVVSRSGLVYKWLSYRWLSYLIVGFQFMLLGNIIGYAVNFMSIPKIILSVLPHGIIEIPVYFAAVAFGITIVSETFSKKEVYGFYGFLIGLLLLAAIIESYITPFLMNFVS